MSKYPYLEELIAKEGPPAPARLRRKMHQFVGLISEVKEPLPASKMRDAWREVSLHVRALIRLVGSEASGDLSAMLRHTLFALVSNGGRQWMGDMMAMQQVLGVRFNVPPGKPRITLAKQVSAWYALDLLQEARIAPIKSGQSSFYQLTAELFSFGVQGGAYVGTSEVQKACIKVFGGRTKLE